ncbi:hypothetical protein MUP77_02690, partial [Candidatus Bathyarchaeota archaeon]|nr:hypothetical protein [Candidatus Bathyarchaeota archaeon]
MLTTVKSLVVHNKLHVFVGLSIAFPIFLLYLMFPSSFQSTWKGRLLYVLFLWIFSLEFVLNWNRIKAKRLQSSGKLRRFSVFLAVFIPLLYISATQFGLSDAIIQLGRVLGVPSGGRYEQYFLTFHWPLSVEYLVLTASFLALIILGYGRRGLQNFIVSFFFIGSMSFFYLVDTFYPYGASSLLQGFVPVVAKFTIVILHSMGYIAQMVPLVDGSAIFINASGGKMFAIAIYWPCAGIHSLLIYSLVIILFLKGTSISFRRKISYAVVGGTGTFLVNILRIVTICQIGINQGFDIASMFH